MADDQEILPPDLARIAAQRNVIDATARRLYGVPLPGGKGDLEILQQLLDDRVFGPDRTYELQSMGIVLGQALAEDPTLSWVTVRDAYGTEPALRYLSTSILLFPLTMISRRVEMAREIDVVRLYAGALAHVRDLTTEVAASPLCGG